MRCPTALSRAVYRCNLPMDLATAVERLNWVAEQVLLHPLHTIARTMGVVEHKCTPLQWQQLEILRDAFVHSAVAHLECELSVRSSSALTLPPSTHAILNQFNKIAADVRSLEQAFFNPALPRRRQQQHQEQEPTHPPIAAAPNPKPLALPPASPPNGPAVAAEADTKASSHAAPVVASPLSQRALQIVRRQSVIELKRALSEPEKFLPLDDSADPSESVAFSSPVSRHAQKRLGDFWVMMEQVGIGKRFVEAAEAGKIAKAKRKPLKPPTPRKIIAGAAQRSFGALDLMGARCVRRGRYVSRKAITGKARRTREKNQKQAEAQAISAEEHEHPSTPDPHHASVPDTNDEDPAPQPSPTSPEATCATPQRLPQSPTHPEHEPKSPNAEEPAAVSGGSGDKKAMESPRTPPQEPESPLDAEAPDCSTPILVRRPLSSSR